MGTFKFLWLFVLFARLCFAEVNLERMTAAMPPPIAAEQWEMQRSFFQDNGYLWIKDFFTSEQVLVLQNWANEMNQAAQNLLASGKPLQSSPNILPPLIIVPERRDPLQVCRVEDMLTCYPDFHHFIETTLTSFIEQLLAEPYVLFKDKLNFKWPGGGAFFPHQDFPAYEGFAPRKHVTAMVCIDSATLQNGCLQVAKNWRKTFEGCPDIDAKCLEAGEAVLPYVSGGSAHGSIQQEYVKKISWLMLKTAPCDLVLISSFVPHYSEPNQSNSPRRAMFFTYNRLQEGEYRAAYYHAKRTDPENPVFHFGTPTKARGK